MEISIRDLTRSIYYNCRPNGKQPQSHDAVLLSRLPFCVAYRECNPHFVIIRDIYLLIYFTITVEILARSLANFHCQ